MLNRLFSAPWRQNGDVPRDRQVLQTLDAMSGYTNDVCSSPGPLGMSEGLESGLVPPGRLVQVCRQQCTGHTPDQYYACPSTWKEVDRSKNADHFSEFQSCREESIISEDCGPQGSHLPLQPVVLPEGSPCIEEESGSPRPQPSPPQDSPTPARRKILLEPIPPLPKHSPKQPPPVNTIQNTLLNALTNQHQQPMTARAVPSAAEERPEILTSRTFSYSREAPVAEVSLNRIGLEEPAQPDRPTTSAERRGDSATLTSSSSNFTMSTTQACSSLEVLNGRNAPERESLYLKMGLQPIMHQAIERDDTITSLAFLTSGSDLTSQSLATSMSLKPSATERQLPSTARILREQAQHQVTLCGTPEAPHTAPQDRYSLKESIRNDDTDVDLAADPDEDEETENFLIGHGPKFGSSLPAESRGLDSPPAPPPKPLATAADPTQRSSHYDEVSPGKRSEQSEFTFQQRSVAIKETWPLKQHIPLPVETVARRQLVDKKKLPPATSSAGCPGSLVEPHRQESGSLVEVGAPAISGGDKEIEKLSTDGYPTVERLKRRQDNNRQELAAIRSANRKPSPYVPEGRPLVLTNLMPAAAATPSATTPPPNPPEDILSVVGAATSEEQSIGRKAETLPIIASSESSDGSRPPLDSSATSGGPLMRHTQQYAAQTPVAAPPDPAVAELSYDYVQRSKSIGEFISPLPSLRLRSVMEILSLRHQQELAQREYRRELDRHQASMVQRQEEVADTPEYIEPTYRLPLDQSGIARSMASPKAEALSPMAAEPTYRLWPDSAAACEGGAARPRAAQTAEPAADFGGFRDAYQEARAQLPSPTGSTGVTPQRRLSAAEYHLQHSPQKTVVAEEIPLQNSHPSRPPTMHYESPEDSPLAEHEPPPTFDVQGSPRVRRTNGLKVRRSRQIRIRWPSPKPGQQGCSQHKHERFGVYNVCKVEIELEPPVPSSGGGGLYKLQVAEQTTSAGAEDEDTASNEIQAQSSLPITPEEALRRIGRLVRAWVLRRRIHQIYSLQKAARTIQHWMRFRLGPAKKARSKEAAVKAAVAAIDPKKLTLSSACSSQDDDDDDSSSCSSNSRSRNGRPSEYRYAHGHPQLLPASPRGGELIAKARERYCRGGRRFGDSCFGNPPVFTSRSGRDSSAHLLMNECSGSSCSDSYDDEDDSEGDQEYSSSYVHSGAEDENSVYSCRVRKAQREPRAFACVPGWRPPRRGCDARDSPVFS